MHPFFAARVSNLSCSASLGEEGSAAQPALHGEGGSAAQPVLAEFGARQKKRIQASAVEERVLPLLPEQPPCGAEQPALKKPALDVTANTKQEAKSSDLA